MFRLLRYFSLTSGAVVAAITLLFVILYARHERAQLVDVEERHNAILARSLANMLLPAYEPYIAAVADLDGDALRQRPETKQIDSGVRQAMEGLPVQKIKVYHPNGLTVYSSELSQIGESKFGNPGYEAAISSKRPVSKISFRDAMLAFSGTRANVDLVESYVPIVDEAGRVRAVFEIYTDVSPQIIRSNQETFRFTLMLLVAFGALYGALFMLVRRADRVIANQYNSLTAFNSDLEKRVTDRTAAAEKAAAQARRTSEDLSREVDDRRRVERELRATNTDLEEATRAKSDFLMAMSHEIRTPLNGVLGMSEILLDTSLSDRQQRLVGTVRHSANGLLAIVNDILDASAMVTGKLVLEQRDFDLWECLEETTDFLSEPAARKGLDLTLFIAQDVPRHVSGDASRLAQAFGNILSNAVKFTEKGRIEISVACLERSEGAARIEVRVKDTGVGIAPEVQKQLFKPFERADNSISRRFGGAGLGLAITKHLVEMMGGSVDLESEPGVGSEVAIAVSLRLANAARSQQEPSATVLDGVRVLILDSRASSRDIIVCYLGDAGAEVTCVQSPDAALQALERARDMSRPFAVLVMDADAPASGGSDAIGMLETTATLWNVGTIRMSAYAGLDESEPQHDDAILLSKPVRRGKLIEAVLRAAGEPLANPLPAPTPAATGNGQHDPSDLGARVLVAEDNPVNQLVAQEYLLALKCSVTLVENGVQAVEAFERECFDVVLMDCQMPEMDGLTATRTIRAFEVQHGFPHIPIVAVTAHAREEDRNQCLAAGMDAFISKPYSAGQLTAELQKWVGERRAAGASAP